MQSPQQDRQGPQTNLQLRSSTAPNHPKKPYKAPPSAMDRRPGQRTMADIVDRVTRSRMMSNIRGKNTLPEVRLRKLLHKRGFRYRLHMTTVPGRPDIVLPKHRAVVLVHGCFWHRHAGCRFATNPASNVVFWREKFAGTMKRDARVVAMLQVEGWRIAVVWECAIESKSEQVAQRLAAWLRSRRRSTEIGVPQRNLQKPRRKLL